MPNGILAAIVQDYISKYRRSARDELQFFKRQPGLAAALGFAGLALVNGQKHDHHSRRQARTLAQATAALVANQPSIQACRDFDKLLSLIEGLVGDIHDIGELYEYDTALWIGAFLGLAPTRVYLHAGTRDGAKALRFDGKLRAIQKSSLPAAFAPLSPREIEDCLCIYKEDLRLAYAGVPLDTLRQRKGCRFGRPAASRRC